MLELNFSKYSSIAPVTWRGRCDVFAESRYAMPVSRIGKSLRIAATSNVDVDITVLHRDRKRPRRDDRGQPRHLAGLHVELRAVLRAFDVELEQLALAEQKVLVRADVVDGVQAVVLAVGEAQLLLTGEHSLDRFDRDLTGRGDPVPSQSWPRARPRRGCARARTGCGRGRRRRSPG